MNGDRNQRYFLIGYVTIQILSAISLVLTGMWTKKYLGGFAWHSDVHKQFNYHILFMVIGFVSLNENGMLVYRLLRSYKKSVLKVIHAVHFAGAFIFTVVALKAVFDSHNLRKDPIANVYTLHSWIGLGAVIMFAAQLFFGLLLYLLPCSPRYWKQLFMPTHRFFGVAVYILAVASCLNGINEKIIFKINGKGYRELPALAVLGNSIGVVLTVKALLVLYLVLSPQFRRTPSAEEDIVELRE